jgi:uncharacterized protein YcfJ
MRTLVCLAVSLALSGGAMAYDGYVTDEGYRPAERYASHGGGYGDNVHYAYGEVLDAQPIYRTTHHPRSREVCWDEPVEYYRRGSGSAAGTLVGALIGGVVGSQIGSGGGRRAATAAGTLLGAAAGHDASRGGGYVSRGYEQRCEVRQEWERGQDVVGYDVTYRYRGEIYQTRTDRHPGDSIRVRVAVEPVY